MKPFEAKEILDMDPYIVIMKIRVGVSDNLEIPVEHEPYWYLKDFPLPGPIDFGLVDTPPELIVPYPSPDPACGGQSRYAR
ncbi:hypothetical protein CJ030_MR7G000068 [Morella rubra]|uniref:Uncharacterized protein n=1 Tax=Morella rubra TaxID=262757 RepID=A0A6A1V2J7_9ROSI|nr:hypothetical protein CJ030_MR7G000068 [Morella rubra]